MTISERKGAFYAKNKYNLFRRKLGMYIFSLNNFLDAIFSEKIGKNRFWGAMAIFEAEERLTIKVSIIVFMKNKDLVFFQRHFILLFFGKSIIFQENYEEPFFEGQLTMKIYWKNGFFFSN